MHMHSKLFILFCLVAFFLVSGCDKNKKSVDTSPVDTIPMMVMQIQKCSRLYTSEYQLRKIVTYGDDISFNGLIFNEEIKINLPMGKRKIAIPMTATVKAYIEFDKFSERNVKRHGDQLEIILPDPEVTMTSTQIDHKSIKKKVSLLRHNFTDEEITDIQQHGRNEMIKALPKLGIIENARQSAARQIIPIIEQMGYPKEKVTITFRKKFSPSDFPSIIRNIE